MQQLSTCIAVDFLTRPIIPNWRFQHVGSAGEKRGAVARNDSRWLMVPTFRKPPAFPETKSTCKSNMHSNACFPNLRADTKKDTKHMWHVRCASCHTGHTERQALTSTSERQAATLNPSAGLWKNSPSIHIAGREYHTHEHPASATANPKKTTERKHFDIVQNFQCCFLLSLSLTLSVGLGFLLSRSVTPYMNYRFQCKYLRHILIQTNKCQYSYRSSKEWCTLSRSLLKHCHGYL